MRYSELHRIAKGKLESTQSKTPNCSSDLALMNDGDVFELVWENGQILKQNRSSRTPKNPLYSTSSSQTFKPQVKDGGADVITETGRLGCVDSMSSDFQSVVLPDDDLMPWLDYQLDDSLHHDYCSELFSELSATNLNLLSSQNSAVSSSRNGNLAHAARDHYMVSTDCHSNPEQGNASKVFGESHEPDRRRISQLYPSPMDECQTSIPSFRSSVSDLDSSSNSSNKNIQQAAFLNSSQKPPLMCGSPSTTMQTQHSLPARPLPQPFSSTGVMNFSHFSRPAALVKANLQSIDTPGGLPRLDRLRSNGKASDFGSSNTLIASTSGSKFVTAFQSQFVSLPSKVDLKSPVAEEPLSSEQSQAVCLEDASRYNGSPPVQAPDQASSFAASTAMGRQDSENIIEPAVPSLSLCSGTSVGGVSNNPKHNLKRKSRDTEESGYQSDEIEEDSMGVRKTGPAQGTGSKRSRAAEVHNLSERRRRDRINEKMKELQELIPNCNKVDKASMLDEAIDYLKTLQLQVQLMSMGTGLCVPPMMLPTGVQHMHGTHLSHFSPVGVGMGMGMGMGLGMGMIDMRGGYAGCPMIQVPSMYGTQFAGQPIPGQSSLPAMARSGLQMFGLPSQGLSTSMLHAPFIPLSGGPSVNPVPMVDTPGTAASVELRDSGLKDPVQNLKLPMIQKKSTDCSQNQTSPQAISEGVEQSALVETDDQNPHISGNGAVNSTCDNRIDSGKATDD